MKKEKIEILVKTNQLRARQADLERINSMLKFLETNVTVAKKVPLDENSATLIFREIYESIRQLGDAQWWIFGYEPRNHEVSMEILKEMEIKEKIKLNHLSRFKNIRNDANYRGFKVSIEQAKEIIDFWDKCGTEVLTIFRKNISTLKSNK